MHQHVDMSFSLQAKPLHTDPPPGDAISCSNQTSCGGGGSAQTYTAVQTSIGTGPGGHAGGLGEQHKVGEEGAVGEGGEGRHQTLFLEKLKK